MNTITEIALWVLSTLVVLAVVSGRNIPYFVLTQFMTTLLISGVVLAVYHFWGFAFIEKIIEGKEKKK